MLRSSHHSPTRRRRGIVVLAKEKYGSRGRDLAELRANFIPFTAQSRMSGVEVGGSWVRRGAVDAIINYLTAPAAAVTPADTSRALRPSSPHGHPHHHDHRRQPMAAAAIAAEAGVDDFLARRRPRTASSRF
jgi:high-affinity K+ transport system ATPase subunit B